jgi:predicted dehydrogenase
MATGWIADQLAEAITDTDDGEIVAAASRTQEKADAFGDKWNIPKRYPTYEALVADPEVDVIYIATPHSHHYDNMLLCLNAGKHVLCEKALTLDAKQAKACIDLAREKGLFLMEAMWMRYNPAITQAKKWIDEGAIGDVRMAKADFCINLPFDASHRLYAPELGGGALLDLGIYPLSFATFFLGLPDSYTSAAHLNEVTGVDELVSMTLNYEDGRLAQLTTSQRVDLPVEALVVGSEGYIKVHHLFFKADTLTLHKVGEEPQVREIPYQSNGYIHEVEEVHKCLRAGKLESERMTLDESLALMEIMDTMRESWGFQYPHEKAGKISSTP